MTILLTSRLIFPGMDLLQTESTDFNDLGKMLVVGFVLAVAAGVAFTVVRLRMRDKNPAQVISITSPQARKKAG